MSCLAAHEISEVATVGGDSHAHVASCAACRARVDGERALRERLRQLPPARMADGRRRELAAELLARAERQPLHAPRSRAWPAAVAAAAAVALAWAWPRAPRAVAIDAPRAAVSPAIAARERVVAREDAAPPAPPRAEAPWLASMPVAAPAGHARAAVGTHSVFGAASSSDRAAVERGALWTSATPAAARSLRAFRDGWVALRDGRNREAIALFDEATDRAVAEEAAYWAAIAARRAGDDELARARLGDFVQRFPGSPYAAQARALIVK